MTKSAQVLQLFTGEVVLAVGAAGPGGQAHVGLVGISAGVDEVGAVWLWTA